MSVTNARHDHPLILVADDDPATRKVLRVEFEGEGYRVVEAADGRAAMAIASEHHIDLAVVDISMPGADGYEVLRGLRSGTSTSTTPVLFLSGRSPGSEAAKALALGAQDYVRKPYDPAELLARVEAALRIKGIQDDMQRRSADLEHLNRTDPLTGLYNRRWLVEQLRSVATSALRADQAYAVLMVDVDHFKAVNDGWGHEAGDRILCTVADRLQRSLRSPDVAGRWGGEEFLIILPDTELHQALIVAERIRTAVGAALPEADVALPPSISASVGCAAGRDLDFSDVVRRADNALYRAKASGRDRVESSGPEPDPATPPPEAPAPRTLEVATAPSAFDLDQRVHVVLSVLAGRDEAEAAGEFGVEVEMVRRWRQMFLEGGRDRVAGRPPPGSDELRDRYLAVLAHELLIPLTVIKGWSSLMASGRLTEEQAAEVPGIILEAAGRMEHTGRDILDSAAVAMGRLRLTVDELDLRQVVDEVVGGIDDAHIAVQPADGPAVPVVADRTRLVQVLTNLLVTARTHGGRGVMEVSLEGSAAEASLRVTTRGQALEFEVAKQLFEPWASNAVVSGSGVGLYVCRALIVAHGGLMGVQGDGEVTTFWIRLPAGGPPAGELVERMAAP